MGRAFVRVARGGRVRDYAMTGVVVVGSSLLGRRCWRGTASGVVGGEALGDGWLWGSPKGNRRGAQREGELDTSDSMNCLVFGPTVDMYGDIPYCHVDGLDVACLRQA